MLIVAAGGQWWQRDSVVVVHVVLVKEQPLLEVDVPRGCSSRSSFAALDVSAQRGDVQQAKLVPRCVTVHVCGYVVGVGDGAPRAARCLTPQALSHPPSAPRVVCRTV